MYRNPDITQPHSLFNGKEASLVYFCDNTPNEIEELRYDTNMYAQCTNLGLNIFVFCYACELIVPTLDMIHYI